MNLEPEQFYSWGRKLALAIQQLLIDRLDDRVEVKIRTDGEKGKVNFSFVIELRAEDQHSQHSRKWSSTITERWSSTYIYKDRVLIDPSGFSVKLSKSLSFEENVKKIAAEAAAGCNLNLSEGKLKSALAAGALAAVTGGSTGGHPNYLSHSEAATDDKRLSFKAFASKQEARAVNLAAIITDKYKVDDSLAIKIAKLAIKYEKSTFPKAEDILSVIGVESSFNPHATSKLKHDPAVGLLQVRPHVWGLDPHRLKTDMEEQIKTGSEILHKYYQKLKSKQATLQAFNVGLTNYMKKKGLNPRYVPKFENERDMYESMLAENARKIALELQQEVIDKGYTAVLSDDHGLGDGEGFVMKIYGKHGTVKARITNSSISIRSSHMCGLDTPEHIKLAIKGTLHHLARDLGPGET